MNPKAKKIWELKNHPAPTTRREFLAYGLIPFAATTFLRNPLDWITHGLFGPSAWAQDVSCPNRTTNWIPFIQVDLAGGAGLMANLVPMDAGGQPLPSYSLMGLGSRPNFTSAFGNNYFYQGSGLLAGINSVLNATLRDRVRAFAIHVASQDDTTSNRMAMNGILQKAGLNGNFLPPIGTVNSQTVGRHQPAFVSVSGPLFANSFNSLLSAIGFTSALSQLNQDQQQRLIRLSRSINQEQAQRLSGRLRLPELQQFVNCAGLKNEEILSSGGRAVDPRQNPTVAGIWGINPNTPANNQNLVFAALVYNSLNGNAGPSTLVLGGYDYHGSPRDQTDQMDNNAGQVIGRIIATANALNTPVFIALTTDGSVGSPNSASVTSFTSDRGSAGSMIGFYFHPQNPPNLRRLQLGHFTSGQVADPTSPVGGTPERGVAAMILNYLALMNREDLLSSLLNQAVFGRDEARSLIVWG